VSGRYHFTERPFLVEGAERVRSLGLGGIKLWFTSVERGYRANSTWNLSPNYTFKDLAEHPYYRAAFDLPFSCIALNIYPVGIRDTTGVNVDILASDADFTADETQIYELTRHLLRTYRNRNLTFLLQNWEGDWMLRGESRRDWNEGRYPGLERRVDSFSRWFSARQRGVERARAEITDTRCRVFHAVEVNKVFDILAGVPTVTSHILPRIRPDFVSWSCYDGLKSEARSAEATAAGLCEGLDLIQSHAQTTQRDFVGKPAVYVGEIGFPEQVIPAEAVTEMLDGAMGALLAREIPYIFYWQLYCNERKDGDRSPAAASDSAEELRGFWLVRPDGTAGIVAQYLARVLAHRGGRLQP
jgi:hypothetical protein